jgi:hypothetical protein
MHCFYHQETNAIAMCRNCGRAVCNDCCEDSGKEIACSESCLQDIRISNQVDGRMRQSLGIGTNPPMPPSVSTYFLFGLILLITGIYMYLQRGDFDFLTFAVAAVFFVMSGVSYKQYLNRCMSC